MQKERSNERIGKEWNDAFEREREGSQIHAGVHTARQTGNLKSLKERVRKREEKNLLEKEVEIDRALVRTIEQSLEGRQLDSSELIEGRELVEFGPASRGGHPRSDSPRPARLERRQR